MSTAAKKVVYLVKVSRENGDKDDMHLCSECLPTTADFLTIISRRRVSGRCDRCGEAGHG